MNRTSARVRVPSIYRQVTDKGYLFLTPRRVRLYRIFGKYPPNLEDILYPFHKYVLGFWASWAGATYLRAIWPTHCGLSHRYCLPNGFMTRCRLYVIMSPQSSVRTIMRAYARLHSQLNHSHVCAGRIQKIPPMPHV